VDLGAAIIAVSTALTPEFVQSVVLRPEPDGDAGNQPPNDVVDEGVEPEESVNVLDGLAPPCFPSCVPACLCVLLLLCKTDTLLVGRSAVQRAVIMKVMHFPQQV
jgi:hypothetical protein